MSNIFADVTLTNFGLYPQIVSLGTPGIAQFDKLMLINQLVPSTL